MKLYTVAIMLFWGLEASTRVPVGMSRSNPKKSPMAGPNRIPEKLFKIYASIPVSSAAQPLLTTMPLVIFD
jgi:hypothetical protein